MENCISRRQKLLNAIPEGVVLISAGQSSLKSIHRDYLFRPNSNFHYLTSMQRPKSILVLEKGPESTKTILFTHFKNKLEKKWHGEDDLVGRDAFRQEIDEMYELGEIEEHLPEILKGHKNVYFDLFSDDNLLVLVQKICLDLKAMRKARKDSFPTSFHDITSLLAELRSIKDQDEIYSIKNAIDITGLGIRAAMAFSAPGKTEKEVSTLLEYIFRSRGGQGSAFPNSVSYGKNATVIHYSKSKSDIGDDELMLLDVGAEYDYYASDISRTFPVNGKFSQEQKEIYEAVLDAQKKTIAMIKPGETLQSIHEFTVRELSKSLIRLGVLDDELEDVIAYKKYARHYPHRTCHWIGLDVHDDNPHFDENGEAIKLAPNMVITVEPGLYFKEKEPSTPAKYKNIGVRIEDIILITADGCINLSKGIPKEIDEIESACTDDYRTYLP